MSCIRYPVDVKAVGFMQCRKQKNYMMFVSWSDQTNILIYRTFEDFKRFHKLLKRKFPIESGSLKRSDRALPRFKDANAKQRRSGKPDRCLEILKLLETYSQELLKMAAKISQGEDVIQFFKAQTQDLDPSFPENRYEIRFPGTELLCTMSCLLGQSRDYGHLQAVKTLSLLFAAGWWLVENADKQIAWFPASYLEEIDDGGIFPSRQTQPVPLSAGSLYFVVRAYESQKADELSLNNGVVVEVVRKSEDGWWLIRPPRAHALAMHSTKSPRLSAKDRNDSGFVESSAADLSSSLTDPDVATCVPKVPARPSAQEILQRCSTVTKRAVQRSRLCSPAPACVPGGTDPALDQASPHH
uniref:NADPH oxidase organizer 1 n=1 Tax=Amazona collaria TaxID=241587 RepID=A0A8B9FUH6_9PSIT